MYTHHAIFNAPSHKSGSINFYFLCEMKPGGFPEYILTNFAPYHFAPCGYIGKGGGKWPLGLWLCKSEGVFILNVLIGLIPLGGC